MTSKRVLWFVGFTLLIFFVIAGFLEYSRAKKLEDYSETTAEITLVGGIKGRYSFGYTYFVGGIRYTGGGYVSKEGISEEKLKSMTSIKIIYANSDYSISQVVDDRLEMLK